VDVALDGAIAVVVAAGELDAFAAPDVSAELQSVRERSGVVVDLSGVSFMDSTILGLIVRATRELSETDARMLIVLPAGPARRIFEITALDSVLPIAESREGAIRDLGG
jgi:anti-sigma B factor antagonist